MKYTIFKHCHYSNFIPLIKWIKNEHQLTKHITFDKSCAYVINEASCVNKLFGFCFGILGVHKNSYRFGWTYNRDTQQIDIYSYIYVDGTLKKNKIYSVNLGEEHAYRIKYKYYDNSGYSMLEFTIDNSTLFQYSVQDLKRHLIFTLGFYFGGNTRAPHKMFITSKSN